MTNKEAKEILEWELNNFKYTDNEFVEATKVAIKALEEGNYESGWMDGYNHALDQTFRELNYLLKNHVIEELRKRIKR